MTDKVIEFPKHKVVREIPMEVHEARQAKADKKFADAIVDELTGFMITELDNFSIAVTDKQFSKDFILVIDALKAAVYRSVGLDHHLHDFIDKNVTLISDGLDGMTNDEIKEKIDQVMRELEEAKGQIDLDSDDEE
jgi:hypothetical protein